MSSMEFSYKAKDDSGKTVTGVLEADSEDALADLLDQQRLFLIEAAPRSKTEQQGNARRIRQRDLITFTVDLSTILTAGIPLSQGLRDLIEAEEHTRLKIIIGDILASIESGSSL